MYKLIASLFCLFLLLTSCNPDEIMNIEDMPAKTEFRVIGYATVASIPDIIPFEQLTHINYAFLLPNADGSVVPPTNIWKLEKIVSLAHEHDVKVLISVGGWGWDEQFEELAANPAAREVFIENLLSFADMYNLDGIDMDWEYPDPGESSQNFLRLMQGLRAGLSEEKLLTAAVVAYGDEHGLGIPYESFELMDFVNLMAYDGQDHSSISQAERSLDYWLGRNLPPEKTVLGLPFYARPTGTSYRKIVESEPEAAQFDEFDALGSMQKYNGIPTIQQKTRLAMERGSGVMFWTLEHDTQDDLSLLLAIDQTISKPEIEP